MADYGDMERRYSKIRTFRRGRRAPHKPLLLAWSIARCLRGLERLVPFDLAERELTALLDAFGPHRSDRPGAHFPFWRLQNDEGVWEIDSPRPVRVDKNGQASRAELRALGVRAGLSADDCARFRADPATAWRVAARLIDGHFPESLRDAVLSAAGFDAVAPPDAVIVSAKPPNLRFRRQTLEIYGGRCAVCGFGLTVSGRPAALAAAHLRWRSHDGDDDPRNAVCLCAVHRAALDAGGFTLIPGEGDSLIAIVSSAAGGHSIQALRRHHAKPIAIPYPPDLRPRQSRVRWHNQEVFRTPSELPTT